MQVIFHDGTTCCKPVQADTFRKWLARNLNSDNGLWYNVDAFTTVMNAYHVNNVTRSPHYLQSNGLAEKYVLIVKSLF